MRRKNVKSRISKALEVPEEVSLKVPKLTILKFEQVLIENYKGILEYQDFFVRIQTYIGIININVYQLSLEEMTIDDLIVKGKIESIDFESVVDEE
ncbi:MAG: YabP/YqfC family sporulation protein [Clostridia bacterium]|nr:YabP/YqfC family sporulation protein [Clostridia bacterium]